LVDEYLKDETTERLASYNGRHLQLCWWRKRYGAVRALEFASPTRLREARDHLRQQGAGDGALSAGTTNRYLAAARACFNWARAAGLLPTNVVWPPRLMVHEAHARDVYLTSDDLTRAMDAADQEGPMWRAAVQFAVGVGLRQSEQLRVRWGDIDEVSQTVAVRVTKTNTSRRVHLPPSVAKALRELLAENVTPLPSAFVFTDAKGAPFKQHVWVDAWHRIRKRAKLPGVRWHDLRHSCASFLAQNGASLLEISHQLGHLSVQTSKRYAHLIAGAKPTGADALNKILGG
jgi:integrase